MVSRDLGLVLARMHYCNDCITSNGESLHTIRCDVPFGGVWNAILDCTCVYWLFCDVFGGNAHMVMDVATRGGPTSPFGKVGISKGTMKICIFGCPTLDLFSIGHDKYLLQF